MRSPTLRFASASAASRPRPMSISQSMRLPPPSHAYRSSMRWRTALAFLHKQNKFARVDDGGSCRRNDANWRVQAMAQKQALVVTDAAAERIHALLVKRG